MLTRRDLLCTGSVLLAGALLPSAAQATQLPAGWIRRDGVRLLKGAEPYRFAGANMWYAAWLGADMPYGNRDRLKRELDALKGLGIVNLRILGAAEHSPLRNSIRPAFRNRGRNYDEALLRGLDFALAEIGRREMHAVIYLTNFWEWSGGMATYLYWTNGGRYIDMNDPAHPWPQFPDFVSDFYSTPRAVALYRDYVRALVTRRNRVTGIAYADDPAIMAWQLANEPRPGGSDAVGRRRLPAYLGWIDATARLIKSLDRNHLVSTGSEGSMGCLGDDECVRQAHDFASVDYVTAHIWPQNWGWADPANLAGTWDNVEARTRDYIARQVAIAERLNKPLVIEEFGFPRDGGSFEPGSPTTFKDRFYALIYDAVEASMRQSGPIGGANFWAWNGEGRAQHADRRFRRGDTAFLGDPPHEPQGWYGVTDLDRATHARIRGHAGVLARGA
jgi:mannan endo-1,4-beta-mannosidase